MKLMNALGAGLAGAIVLTTTHQLLHKLLNDAPRMDLMGEEALEKLAGKANTTIKPENLYNITMAGDIVVNSLYYSLMGIGKPKYIVIRSTLHGLIAGIGGVYLPKHFGLTNAFSNRSNTTKLLTIGIYTLGGLVTGVLLSSKSNSARKEKTIPEWRKDIED